MFSSNATDRVKHPHKISGSTQMKIRFVLTRNVTAQNGMRTVYVRVLTPAGNVLNGGVQCDFEGQQIACTAKKDVEYTGEEKMIEVFAPKTTLTPGNYRVQVIADGHEIGARTIELEK